MASKAAISKQLKREKLVKKFLERRELLIEEGNYTKLQDLPRNAAPTRLRNRCAITGRSRGYIRRLKMSRIALREMSQKGFLPGVKKLSW